ncbi:MAG: tetratricopeptide repeat protein [Bacteroidales bacterium]|jgi:TolA-binding protein|nr:tetratricopeptide repeat protein [Bacteroidales bacterium]
MAKKTEKEVKQEKKFEASLENLQFWYNKYKKMLLGVVIAIVVIVVAVVAYKFLYQAPRELEAHEVAFYAQNYFEKDSLEYALSGDGANMGFLDIISDYSGTAEANLAKYYVGLIYVKQANYEEALDYLKDFNPKGDLFLLPQSLSLIGDCYAQTGNLDNALTYYEKIIKKSSNESIVPGIILKAAAICDLNGNHIRELELYKKLKSDFIRSQEAQNADKLIQIATAKL